MVSDLHDALKLYDTAVEIDEYPAEETLDPIVDAARRVANPDIEAAAIPIAVALADVVSLATGQAVAVEFIDDEMKAIAKNAVNLALGITEDE